MNFILVYKSFQLIFVHKIVSVADCHIETFPKFSFPEFSLFSTYFTFVFQSNLHPNTITHHFTSTCSTSTTNATATRSSRDSLSSAIISRSHILVRLKQDQINFRWKETCKNDRRTDAQTQRKTWRLYFVVIASTEIDGYRSKEYDACGVHSESNIFRLVEIFRNFPRFECINRAEWNEKYYKDEWDHEAVARAFAY